MIGKAYVIGLTGQATAGKDTFAEMMKDSLLVGNIRRFAFADQLKTLYKGMQATGGLAEDYFLSRMEELGLDLTASAAAWEKVMKPVVDSEAFRTSVYDESTKAVHRVNLIAIGNGMREEVHPDMWIKTIEKEINEWSDSVEFNAGLRYAVITDVRYQNEAEMCDFVIRVVRPMCPIIYDTHKAQVSPSEHLGLTGTYDMLVDNSKDLEFLKAQAHNAMMRATVAIMAGTFTPPATT